VILALLAFAVAVQITLIVPDVLPVLVAIRPIMAQIAFVVVDVALFRFGSDSIAILQVLIAFDAVFVDVPSVVVNVPLILVTIRPVMAQVAFVVVDVTLVFANIAAVVPQVLPVGRNITGGRRLGQREH
jgi:hypothetical protein